jgi:hypothetical protein
MNPILLQVIYITIIFFLGLILMFVLKFGGSTLRQVIKSKLPGFKHKGAWFIQSDKGRKVRFIYRKIPKDLRIKIKSGSVPEEDQYAHINEIFHQTDGDGVPVLFTLEDLPFTFFLKKHHLETFFPMIDEMINLIDEIVGRKAYKEAEQLKLIIKNKLAVMKSELKYIPSSAVELEQIFNLEKNVDYQDKHAIILILKYKQHLLKIKESILENNHQMVDVHDLFQTIGFVKNLTNIAFLEYQNGFLASKQTKMEKRMNTVLMVLVIMVGVLVLVGIYMSYSVSQDIDEVVLTINQQSDQINQLNQSLGINLTDETQPVTANPDLNTPVNPLQ